MIAMASNRWFILAVLFLARTAMGFQFQSIASVSPFLIDELAIDYAMLGTLIGLYMLPGILFALPGGVLRCARVRGDAGKEPAQEFAARYGLAPGARVADG